MLRPNAPTTDPLDAFLNEVSNEIKRTEFLSKMLGAGEPAPLLGTLKTSHGMKRPRIAELSTPLVVAFLGGWEGFSGNRPDGLLGFERPGCALTVVTPFEDEQTSATSPDRILVSDSDLKISKAFGLAFPLNKDLIQLYEETVGTSLRAPSSVMIPALYVVAQDQFVNYAMATWSFRSELDPNSVEPVIAKLARGGARNSRSAPTRDRW